MKGIMQYDLQICIRNVQFMCMSVCTFTCKYICTLTFLCSLQTTLNNYQLQYKQWEQILQYIINGLGIDWIKKCTSKKECYKTTGVSHGTGGCHFSASEATVSVASGQTLAVLSMYSTVRFVWRM
jgi:hypothetical protein